MVALWMHRLSVQRLPRGRGRVPAMQRVLLGVRRSGADPAADVAGFGPARQTRAGTGSRGAIAWCTSANVKPGLLAFAAAVVWPHVVSLGRRSVVPTRRLADASVPAVLQPPCRRNAACAETRGTRSASAPLARSTTRLLQLQFVFGGAPGRAVDPHGQAGKNPGNCRLTGSFCL